MGHRLRLRGEEVTILTVRMRLLPRPLLVHGQHPHLAPRLLAARLVEVHHHVAQLVALEARRPLEARDQPVA